MVFTVIGVALSIALTVTMFSIGEGLRTSTDTLVEETNVDLFVIPKGSNYILGKSELSNGTALAEDIRTDLDADRRMRAETVLPRYIPKRELYLRPADDPEADFVGARANGLIPSMLGDVSGFKVTDGGYFNVLEDTFKEDAHFVEANYTTEAFESDKFTKEIVINEALAHELDVEPGQWVLLSANRTFRDNVSVAVKGVYKAQFESSEYRTFHMHLAELQYMLQRWDDPVTEILIILEDPSAADAVKEYLENDREYSDRVTVSTADEIYADLAELYGIFEDFATLIAFITMVVALLFIVTVMVISVKERTREIGALRAIGFSRSSIFKMVLLEGFIIAAAGFIIGLFFGFIDAWVLDEYIRRTVTGIPAGIHVTEITWVVVLQVTLLGMLIGAVAGLLPAYWATRVNIAQTLRQE